MKSRSRRATSRSSEGGGRAGAIRAALLAAAALAACDTAVLGPQQDALDEARERWAAASIESYTLEVQRSCFCIGEYVRPIRVEVRDGAVVGAVFADDGEALPAEIEPPTVALLFEEIQTAIEREAHAILASYDDALGYPLDVSIDFIAEAVDEEMAFRVHRLDPVTPAAG